MKTKSILIVSSSSDRRLSKIRIVVALSETNFVFEGIFYFSSNFNVFYIIADNTTNSELLEFLKYPDRFPRYSKNEKIEKYLG